MARISAKLCQNAFWKILHVSFFGAKKKLGEIFGSKISFFAKKVRFWATYGQTDVKISFHVKFCSR